MANVYSNVTSRSTQHSTNRGTHSRKISWGASSPFRVICILHSIHMKNILLIVEG
ncbi:hypothetical protein Plhal304r1_c057g0142541 [Plasmopara halstedii]